MKKLVFFGSSEYSKRILNTLKSHYEIALVVTRADKPVGRKQILTATPVSVEAEARGIPVIKPATLKDDAVFEQIKTTSPDLLVVIAYGKIIPKRYLDLVPNHAVNIHPSLLPLYRGASPIASALLNGETETGVSIMLMDELMDHGPILAQQKLAIGPNETLPELTERLIKLSEQMIITTLSGYLHGEIKPAAQDHSKATACAIISKEDGKIDWAAPARDIYNKYRAFMPWPGIWTRFQDKILKIASCRLHESEAHAAAGTVVMAGIAVVVQCGIGALELNEVQLEGKNKTSGGDFARGHRDFIGSKLS